MSEAGELLCLDSLPDAVIVADAAGRVVFSNRRARDLFGLHNPTQSAPFLGDILFGIDFSREAARGVSTLVECVRADGSPFRADVCAAFDGQQWFVSIRPSVSSAEREARAEAALEQQRAFFSLFNHDVRQSLQAIQFLSETLEPSSPETVAIITEIVASVRRLLDTVLRLSDSGALTAEAEPCALGEVLQGLRLELEPVARRKGLALEVGATTEHVHTDPVLLRELLQNLVGNAIRYTREGGVRVHCRASSTDVRLEICDTGVGIGEKQLERLLSAPSAAPRPSAPARGTGLGLVIVKRLADMLGFQLEATSRLGEGSSFTVTIPRARLDAGRASDDDVRNETASPSSIGAG